jgi:hypothetical protein
MQPERTAFVLFTEHSISPHTWRVTITGSCEECGRSASLGSLESGAPCLKCEACGHCETIPGLEYKALVKSILVQAAKS